MAPIKDELSQLTAKLSSNARVDLYDKNYLYHLKWTSPMLLLAVSIVLSALFSFGFIGQTYLMVSSLVCLGMLIVVQLIARRARIAALKGDTIILKGIHAKSTITSIGSVKKANTVQIFGIQITRLYYTLDHRKKSSLVFGSPSGMRTSLDQLIHHAKKCRKK